MVQNLTPPSRVAQEDFWNASVRDLAALFSKIMCLYALGFSEPYRKLKMEIPGGYDDAMEAWLISGT
jgi:hypothetical protein